MRPSLKFRPAGLSPLEDRVVMSSAAAIGNVQPGPKNQNPSPQSTVEGNVGNFHGLSIAQTIQAGNPVYENITTNYRASVFNNNTVSSEGETRLIVPDKATHTVTTTRNITLRNNEGYEKIVDVATTTGKTTNHQITTSITHPTYTAPDGTIIPTTTLTQTETETEQVQGGKTYTKGTIVLPGGSVETFTGTVSTAGNATTTSQTLTDPMGLTTKTNTVVTVHNELYQSTIATVIYPDGTTTTSKSNSWVLRLEPPLPQQQQ